MKFNFAHVVAYKQLTKVIIAKLVLLIGALFFNLSFNLGALEFFRDWMHYIYNICHTKRAIDKK